MSEGREFAALVLLGGAFHPFTEVGVSLEEPPDVRRRRLRIGSRWRHALASRTATISSADQANKGADGLTIILDVTAAGTGSITLSIELKDPASGKYVALLTGVAVTANGTTLYRVFRGATAVANATVNDQLPRTWRVTVTHNNANAITYSVGASVID